MKYLLFTFREADEEKQEMIIATLSNIGFEGFEQKEDVLEAFVDEMNFSEEKFTACIKFMQALFPIAFSKQSVPIKNWNQEWENNFQPLMVADIVYVRASFHQPSLKAVYEIVVDPKMAFGTGHHATTALVMEIMLKENIQGKNVLDFGCGTGILSILASKLKCESVLAVDNDEKAIENAKENFKLNHVVNARLILGNKIESGKFDVVIANITREIIIQHLFNFNLILSENGILILSGFLQSDAALMISHVLNHPFTVKYKLIQGEWMAMVFQKVT